MMTKVSDFKGILHINGLRQGINSPSITNNITSQDIYLAIEQFEGIYLIEFLGTEIALPFIQYLENKESEEHISHDNNSNGEFSNVIPFYPITEENEDKQKEESAQSSTSESKTAETDEKWEKLISYFRKYKINPAACYVYFNYVFRNPKSIGSQDNTTPNKENVYNNVSVYLTQAWNRMVAINFALYNELKKDEDFKNIPDNTCSNIFSLRNPNTL